MTKKLLLTTDDFGMCHAINEGIVQAITQGLPTSTNFLAPAPWFREAAELAKANKLEVGVHLCLTSDWDRLKWGPLTANQRLMTEDGSLPSLHTGLEALGATDQDMYDELKAQIALVRKVYGQPTHVDTHMAGGSWGAGILDRLQRVILKVAAEEGLPYTYEREPGTERLRHFVEEDCQSGWNREQLLDKLRSWTAPGAYHIYGHAALPSPELYALCSLEHPSRVWAEDYRLKDQALYMDKSLRAEIGSLGFQIVGVRDALAA
jgi:predicted glycoside hydrolase/deacetylase ChbG (UPF0249 family)